MAKPERNAAVVRAVQAGATHAEVAGRFGISQRRVGQLVRAARHSPIEATRYAPRPAQTQRTLQAPTWPDGTPMHELQIVLVRMFALLPRRMSQAERDALMGTVALLLRAYYPEPTPYTRQQVLTAVGVGL